MKYLVMECDGATAIVLSEDGRFLKVADQGYQVGQKLSLAAEIPQRRRAPRLWLTLGTLAACLVLVFTGLFRMGQLPYGSVYLSINPAVRIDVNRQDRVVGLEGTNADGDVLIQDYSYTRKDLELVMDELVDRAIDMGFLHEGGQITLALDGQDEGWVVSHRESLPTHLTQKLSVTVTVQDAAREESQKVVIPLDPYGESDYGPTESSAAPEMGSTDYDPDGDTNYLPEQEGLTDYDPDNESDSSDYQQNTQNSSSDYEPPETDGQSDYIPPEEDGGSDYEPPEEAGESNYAAPENSGGSDYGPGREAGDSGYKEDENSENEDSEDED